MIVTIKDLAKEAGVSLGTVSNVLNGRNNVSLEKIEKVRSAIEKLGYKRNSQASQLKRRKSDKVAIILPNISEIKYSLLYENLELFTSKNNLTLVLFLTQNQKEKERKIIQRINEDNFIFLLVDSCLDNASFYSEVSNLEKIIFVYRKIKNAINFVGFDYSLVFDSLIRKLIKVNHNDIILLKEKYNDWSDEDYKQFIYKAHLAGIKVEILEDYSNLRKFAFKFAQESNSQRPLIIPSLINAEVFEQAYYFSNKEKPIIYTFSDNHFRNDYKFIKFRLDYDHIFNKIYNIIEGKEYDGFSYHFGILDRLNYINHKQEEIYLIAISNPAVDALINLLPHFEKETGIKVNIDLYSFDEITKILEDNKWLKKYDMVRIDMESLPYFSEEYFSPLTEITEKELEFLYPKNILNRYSLYNDKVYAIPFDPSIQMLFYRKDIFLDQRVKRLFYEKNRRDLTLPSNFDEFNILSDFFKNDLPKNFNIEYGSALITHDTATLATEFLMRYYSHNSSIFENQNIKLNEAAAKKTLRQLKELSQSSLKLESGWWGDAVKLLHSGCIPMLIVYFNHFSTFSDSSEQSIGTVAIPNHCALMGGGSLAILKETEKKSSCQLFFKWFMQDFIQEQYMLLGGISVKNSSIANKSINLYLNDMSFASQFDFDGIRENTVDGKKPINLRKVEHIIGSVVKNYLTSDISEDFSINLMNNKLKNS